MNRVTDGLIDKARTQATRPAVTMYLPAHRSPTPPHMREDEARFKKIAHRALGILDNIDKHDSFNKRFAEWCDQLLGDESFWKERAGSVLLCAQDSQFEIYDLPMDTDEYVAVDDHYHFAPVYGILEDHTPFFVLAISQHDSFLFEGDEYGLELTMQNSSSDIVHTDAGHHPYFRRVAMEFFSKLDTNLPLILAGVSSDIAEYRSLNDYPHMLDQSIAGSYGSDSRTELFTAGWQIVSDNIIEAKHRERLADYRRLIGEKSPLASDDIANIKDAAAYGRIDTLFVGMSSYTTDTIEDSVEPAKKILFPDEIESEVIDLMTQKVWGQHGHIMNINEDQLPGSSLMYALYRY